MGNLRGNFIRTVQWKKQTVPGLINAAFLFFPSIFFRGNSFLKADAKREQNSDWILISSSLPRNLTNGTQLR